MFMLMIIYKSRRLKSQEQQKCSKDGKLPLQVLTLGLARANTALAYICTVHCTL